MPKLTETRVRKFPHTKIGTEKYWDSEVRGLVLFVGKRSKTWYFQRDIAGKTRRVMLGRYPIVGANAARQTALELALDWGRGAGKLRQVGSPTLEAATEAYLARPKLRSETHKNGIRQQFRLHLSDWLGLRLDDISKKMVVDRHRAMAKTPSGANHVLKYFRSVWNHARRVYDLSECPTIAVEWYEEKPAGLVIEDFAAWKQAIDHLDNPIHSAFYQLLLFTGFRKTEALTLQWQHVHDEHIHLPMTKNGRSFDLPILPLHQEILAPMRGLSQRWVFPSPKSVDGHISNPCRLAWNPHMHRRSFATVAVEAGVMEEIVGRLLNHTPISITGQRYAKPSIDALRPSMKVICDALLDRIAAKRERP